MKRKIWIVIVAAVVLALAAGTITAQNIIDGEKNRQHEEAPEDLNGTGCLVGRIDSHSVEIEIDGEFRAFGLSDALRDGEFAAGPVSFKYYIDENGRSILTELIAEQPVEAEVKTVEGIFNGLADSHTVEIEIDGEAMAFGLAAGISFTGIEEGEPVFIAYSEIGGRQVIIKVERLF